MGHSQEFEGFSKFSEVREIIKTFRSRKYSLEYCSDIGLYMFKYPTEVRLIPETDRLRLVIHDDGQDVSETYKALRIAEKIVLKYGYKRGENIIIGSGFEESDDEFYNYFKLAI